MWNDGKTWDLYSGTDDTENTPLSFPQSLLHLCIPTSQRFRNLTSHLKWHGVFHSIEWYCESSFGSHHNMRNSWFESPNSLRHNYVGIRGRVRWNSTGPTVCFFLFFRRSSFFFSDCRRFKTFFFIRLRDAFSFFLSVFSCFLVTVARKVTRGWSCRRCWNPTFFIFMTLRLTQGEI